MQGNETYNGVCCRQGVYEIEGHKILLDGWQGFLYNQHFKHITCFF